MPEFIQLTERDKIQLDLNTTTVISPKQKLFLEMLGLGHFLQDVGFQKELYDLAKKEGLRKVKMQEMQQQDWRVQNALVLAFRRSLWG